MKLDERRHIRGRALFFLAQQLQKLSDEQYAEATKDLGRHELKYFKEEVEKVATTIQKRGIRILRTP